MEIRTQYGDLRQVEIGTSVMFKSDVEQCAEVVEIKGDWLVLKAPLDGFSGAYIGRCDFTEIHISEIF